MSRGDSGGAGPAPRAKQLRGEDLEAKVLEVVLGEVCRVGYEKLAIEQVAARAGVNKVTLYRRWPTKQELVQAAIRRAVDVTPEEPDTGTLRGDLIAHFDVLLRTVVNPALRALFRLLFDAREDEPLGALVHGLRAQKDAQAMQLYERGIARGELPPDVDPRFLHGVLFGAVINFALLQPPGTRALNLEALVDLVLTGARPPPKRAPSASRHPPGA
ncbi:TetR/AcrR family transcriptional regulator [[Archangium] primigenium]|uniref:TetR/AcrR family transcriptional regulator n=1 Tax=Melittangium TaxID=44 RepID=UPI00195AFBAC|nr:TetR/AcrR family transcriptional regulator [Archangium primigenium]MBM7116999.1 TetR/AcrR family transcriptional regulator [Archangium primigenium]